MALSIADQIALDDALVAPADRLRIGKCNLRLSSDVTSKEATLQVVYDVLKLTPFYKAFQVTADAPEIYMQEFWASAYVHNRSVRFKMNNKKHIIGLEQFRDILQICPRVRNKKCVDPPLLRRRSHLSSYLPTAPKEKKSGKRKQKTSRRGDNNSGADLTELSTLKIAIKSSRQETHSLLKQVVLEQMKELGVKPQGFPDAPDYDSEDDYIWQSAMMIKMMSKLRMMTMQRNMTFMKLPRKKRR
ncbi:hypothetical protein Tco_0708267 [Tanacetum coccineum]